MHVNRIKRNVFIPPIRKRKKTERSFHVLGKRPRDLPLHLPMMQSLLLAIFHLTANRIFQSFCHMPIDKRKIYFAASQHRGNCIKSNVIHQNHLFAVQFALAFDINCLLILRNVSLYAYINAFEWAEASRYVKNAISNQNSISIRWLLGLFCLRFG